MMNRDEATLLDIAHAVQLLLDFTHGLTREEFEHDLKTQSAALHQLMILGEAVKRLSSGFRSHHPAVPWSLIAGMRDHLIHAYDTVDFEEVWNTIRRDIPALREHITPLLPPSGDRS